MWFYLIRKYFPFIFGLLLLFCFRFNCFCPKIHIIVRWVPYQQRRECYSHYKTMLFIQLRRAIFRIMQRGIDRRLTGVFITQFVIKILLVIRRWFAIFIVASSRLCRRSARVPSADWQNFAVKNGFLAMFSLFNTHLYVSHLIACWGVSDVLSRCSVGFQLSCFRGKM